MKAPTRESANMIADAVAEAAHPLGEAAGSANPLQSATQAWVEAVQKYYEREPNRNELTQVFMRGYFAGWSEREVAQLADTLADNVKRLPCWSNKKAEVRGEAPLPPTHGSVHGKGTLTSCGQTAETMWRDTRLNRRFADRARTRADDGCATRADHRCALGQTKASARTHTVHWTEEIYTYKPEEARAAQPKERWLNRLIRPFRLWLNRITADEGCTTVDARKLREYNHGLAEENSRYREALVRLRDCDWTISLPDRMDAVRDIARSALSNADISDGRKGTPK